MIQLTAAKFDLIKCAEKNLEWVWFSLADEPPQLLVFGGQEAGFPFPPGPPTIRRRFAHRRRQCGRRQFKTVGVGNVIISGSHAKNGFFGAFLICLVWCEGKAVDQQAGEDVSSYAIGTVGHFD